MDLKLVLVVNAAIIRDGKLLVVKKKNGDSWILPGGKKNLEEDDFACLRREISEELLETKIEKIKSYKTFYDFNNLTPNTKKYLHARVYFAKIKGELYGVSSEICDFAFVDRQKRYNLSPLTSKVLDDLIIDGYI